MEKSKALLIVGIGLLALGVVWFYVGRKPTVKANYTQEIKSLKEQNDSLVANNLLLDRETKRLQLLADSLQLQVLNKRKVITELKKVKHEKIKAISDYSNDKLFRFFAAFETDSSTIGR
jgi:hypothetical protein